MRPVFIRSAELGAPFTDKPQAPLRQSMTRAAARAIERAGLHGTEIDAIFVAAMGSFAHEQFMGALPLALASELGLDAAEVSPMLIGTSETGAWALRSAVQALRHDDRWRHVLVVSGEQMNPLADQRATTPAERFAERRARNRTISQVVDPIDQRYGLNMLRMSDLIMDQLSHLHDWSLPDLTDLVLPFVALEKYRRVRRYPFGQFHANHKETLAQYHRSARLTHYFRLDDVTPTSSGSVALVLSTRPDGPARTVEILGMGQGWVPASLTARTGDPTHMQSISDAFARAVTDAGVASDWLLSCDFAVIHDAFPSIEYFFLCELGLGPEDIVRRMVSGWSNPFGGLKGCGHALGASGMLQVAKSFHAFSDDPRYITPLELRSPFPELVREPPFETCFTTSVGGVLSNVLVTLLAAHDGPRTTLTPPAPGLRRDTEPSIPAAPVRAQTASPMTAREGDVYRVLARTRLRHTPAFGDDELALTRRVPEPWIVLLEAQVPAGGAPGPRRLAWATTRHEVGALVGCARSDIDGLWRVEPLRVERPHRPYVEDERDGDRVRFLVDLERRLVALGHTEAPVEFLPRTVEAVCVEHGATWLAYAQLRPLPDDEPTDQSEQSFLKARLMTAGLALPVGTLAEIRRIDGQRAPAAARAAHEQWTRRQRVVHPALPGLIEVGHGPGHQWVASARELPHGVTLARTVGARHADEIRVVRWARDVVSAVAALHDAGLVHGRVDPQHVVITPRERVMLVEPRLTTPLVTATFTDDLRGLGLVLLALAVRNTEARAALAPVASRCLGWSSGSSWESARAVLDALPPVTP